MKIVSQDEKGTLVEFENLVQHTAVIGVSAPLHARIPPGKLTAFEKSIQLAEQAGKEAARRFMAMQ